ncbi:glycosyltransferase family 4 protein [Rickettsia asembonensis]|uniref:Glycosyl transferase family 1 n=1 Tax=Rickettsia asembonensis TaxID=1068590 RepID=A0A0C2M0L8_9RICK|nr:glycosyltransferase family 4 protein [Rickettsia asembonensis]KIJ89252.1 glycosyl transferase family 1 [Rickettsia asembonensis]WCR57142.1 MAG: UDP-N-acetylglucosamine--peptide N-acetylglucosaminyltransferase GtfA subunit [Rickettsia asembonensis]
MKILNIMLSRDLGGIQQAFLDYNAALEMQKIEVINITSYKAKINSFLHKTSFKLPNLVPIDPLSVLILKYIIYKIKPNIIIAHGNRAINFSKFAKSQNIKLIGIAHNYSLKGLRKCDFIIALTHHMKKFLLKNNFAESRICTLPNMINISKDFTPNKTYRKPIVIGVLARFVAKKGVDVFINAIKILKEKKYDIKVVIGGSGEEKDNLIALARKLNLQDQISFTGWVNDRDNFFKQIDIFCLPSLHEPFGIIVLEAMEASIPIVSTDTEGPAEILSDMQDGLICKAGSAEDLAEKIAYLIDNPIKAKEFSKNAYLTLKQNYNIKVISEKLATLLHSYKNS